VTLALVFHIFRPQIRNPNLKHLHDPRCPRLFSAAGPSSILSPVPRGTERATTHTTSPPRAHALVTRSDDLPVPPQLLGLVPLRPSLSSVVPSPDASLRGAASRLYSPPARVFFDTSRPRPWLPPRSCPCSRAPAGTTSVSHARHVNISLFWWREADSIRAQVTAPKASGLSPALCRFLPTNTTFF
jgi:hypothetical protein